jgi:hypothetical protein
MNNCKQPKFVFRTLCEEEEIIVIGDIVCPFCKSTLEIAIAFEERGIQSSDFEKRKENEDTQENTESS